MVKCWIWIINRVFKLIPARNLVSTHRIRDTSQLFEKGYRRNLVSHFGAFKTQCKIGVKLEPLTKAFHFSTKTDETFCGVRGDARAAGTIFLGVQIL